MKNFSFFEKKKNKNTHFSCYSLDNDVIYLDPHIVRPSLKPENFSAEEFHCTVPLRMPFSNMDPSLILGFYCKDETDFDSLCDFLKGLSPNNPILTVEDKTPGYLESKFDEIEDFHFLEQNED